MKKNVLIAGFIILFLVFLLSVVSPYNLFHYFNAESKVTKILSDSRVKLELLDDDSKVTNVKYLGSNVYQVKTEEGIYLMEIKTKKSKTTINVFEHKKHAKQFMD